MKMKKFFEKICRNPNNIRFDEMVIFVENLGFTSRRKKTSHQFFTRPDVEEVINLQERKGEVKPYQVRQVIAIVRKYNLL
jgi:predicted RNA binding protein YcfA (HicA-like mRNA interferase family)